MKNVTIQKLLPRKPLGRFFVFLGRIKIPFIKNVLITLGTSLYKLNMQEAIVEDKYAYKTVTDLFIRKLKPSARPIDPDPNTVCSPCDGKITQYNLIDPNITINAKKHFYSTDELLGTEAHSFNKGLATTIYLAPNDYHRVHMPVSGEITSMKYIPGKLLSVDPVICEQVPGMLSLNERVVINGQNTFGKFAIVMVGAITVGHIHIKWQDLTNPNHPASPKQWIYQDQPISLNKGEEIGYFTFGSTVVLLSDNPKIQLMDEICLNQKIQLGQVLART